MPWGPSRELATGLPILSMAGVTYMALPMISSCSAWVSWEMRRSQSGSVRGLPTMSSSFSVPGWPYFTSGQAASSMARGLPATSQPSLVSAFTIHSAASWV